MLAAKLAAVGTVPVESVAIILGVHRLMSQGLTPTNLVSNGVATLVIAKWEGALDERRLRPRSTWKPRLGKSLIRRIRRGVDHQARADAIGPGNFGPGAVFKGATVAIGTRSAQKTRRPTAHC